jgi:hypothetical protein
VIVVADPGADLLARVVEAEKQRFVQELIAHAPVEALAEAILHGLARRDVTPLDLAVARKREDRVRGELRPVVGDDHARFAAPPDQRRQLPGDAIARDRRVGDRREAFARHVVDDVENAEPPATGELVMHEVQRPARVRLRLDKDRRPRSDRAAAGPALAHREPFLAVKPVDAVLARALAFLTQQDEQSSVAEAAARIGKFPKSFAQFPIRRALWRIADRRAVDGDDVTGPTLRQAHDGPKVRDGFAPGGGPYHFFPRSSRSAAASSI